MLAVDEIRKGITMLDSNRKLFGEALLQALAEKYDEELAECTEDAICSAKHLKKMDKIIGVKVSARDDSAKRKKLWVAILVAAALLLVGCTVYTYRKQIGNFIERLRENYFSVSAYTMENEEEDQAVLTEIYTLSYVPEGYELVNNVELSNFVIREWKNENGEFIRFEQSFISQSQSHKYGIDDQTEYIMITTPKRKEVYYREKDDKIFVVWEDEAYIIAIVSTAVLPQDVLFQIIDGVVIE